MNYSFPLVAEGISNLEIDLLIQVVKSGNLTMGKRVETFEEKFAQVMHVRNAIMVNSGSSANLLALESLVRSSSNSLFKSGHENRYIAVPSVLWPTTIWPIIQLGFRALIIDVLPNSLEMDLNALKRAKKQLGEKLAGAFIIHPLGKSVELSEIIDHYSQDELFVIEDTCESLGARNKNGLAGTSGIAGTYSFYYSHHITTIEGGMVVTNNDELADDLRSMRAHGWTRNRRDKNRWNSDFGSHEEDFIFVTSGFNFRPMEIQGALGLSQLNQLDQFIARRQVLASRVASAVQNCEGISLIDSACARYTELRETHSWMSFPFLIDDIENRRKILEHFNNFGIQTRPILSGNFFQQVAAKNKKIKVYEDVLNAKKIHQHGFMIGNHHSLSDNQVQVLIDCIESIHT